jgi:hypothetical protein
MKILIFAIFAFASVAAFGQADIHGVDFKNFTYRPYCIGKTPMTVRVKDGEYSKETQADGYVDRFFFTITDVAYGDLNADGKDEAVVIGVCNTGGTGNFSEGFIYTQRTGKTVLAARFPGGDRAYGGLRETRVDGGILSIDSNDVGEAGGACCPEYVITSQYKLSGAKLVPVGKPTRRELYPKERLTFARGMSSKTFTVRVDAQDIKRYTLGARAGQVMSVTLNTGSASLRLLDDATVTEGENSFTAKLPKNGDYTFEIQNIDNKAIDVTVTVKIK